jgi:hypothetical protein
MAEMTHYQYTLSGHRSALGSIQDRVRGLMEADEGCRNDDMEMLAQLWMEDGLEHVIPPEFHEPLVSFLVSKATNAKTALNRRQDLQREPGLEHLAPSPDVAEKRGQGK